jgi:hypothetical protein
VDGLFGVRRTKVLHALLAIPYEVCFALADNWKPGTAIGVILVEQFSVAFAGVDVTLPSVEYEIARARFFGWYIAAAGIIFRE